MLLEVQVEVTLWLTVGQSVRLGVGHPFGAHDQILITFEVMLPSACSFIVDSSLSYV
jgi:hypothetical protein